jgi:hypothetical protein
VEEVRERGRGRLRKRTHRQDNGDVGYKSRLFLSPYHSSVLLVLFYTLDVPLLSYRLYPFHQSPFRLIPVNPHSLPLPFSSLPFSRVYPFRHYPFLLHFPYLRNLPLSFYRTILSSGPGRQGARSAEEHQEALYLSPECGTGPPSCAPSGS